MASVVFGAEPPDADSGPRPRRRGGRARILHRMSRRQRAGLAGGVVVVLAAAGVGIWLSEDSSAAATPTSELVAAASSPLRQTVSARGTIEPAQQANLNFATSGQVTSVSATVGEKVTAGKVLATVSSASLSGDVAQGEAPEAPDAAKLSSDQAASVTSAQLTADQTAVTAAENQVTDAKQALAEANLTSPITGVVAAVDLSVGQEVSGGGSSGGGSSGGSGGSGRSAAGGPA